MDVAVTALNAASTRLAVAAHNLANINTPDFQAMQAIQVEQPSQRGVSVYTVRTDEPTDLVRELVQQSMTLRYAQVNGRVIKTYREIMGEVVNLFA